jgi:hypothetical protein
VRLFLLNESPNLVALYVSARNVADVAVEYLPTPLSHECQQGKNRGVVRHSFKALDVADPHSFDQETDYGHGGVKLRVHAAQGPLPGFVGR